MIFSSNLILMNNLKKALAPLKQVEPDTYWVNEAKHFLLGEIEHQQAETVVQAWFKKAEKVKPALGFLQSARVRLMHRVGQQKSSWLERLMGLKQLLASALVLVLAVGTTSFFSDEEQAIAGESVMLEARGGGVKIQNDLVWEKVSDWQEIKEGDLLRTDEFLDQATLHFYENQLRLGPNTVLLVTELNEAGVRVNVSQGKVWLNAPALREEKGFVTLETPNASILTTSGNVAVQVQPFSLTQAQAFSGVVRVTHASPNKSEVNIDVLMGEEQINVHSKKMSQGIEPFNLEEAKNNPWVLQNLQLDEIHEGYLKKLNAEKVKKVLLAQ